MATKRRTRRDFGKVTKKGNRFYAEYTGMDTARHTPGHSFATRTDADGWLSTERRLMDLGTWTPPAMRKDKAAQDSTTVGQWMDKYHEHLMHRARPVRASTMQNYQRVTRTRITAPSAPGNTVNDITRLASIPLTKLTKTDVYRWWDAVQRTYTGQHTANQQAYKRLRAACAEAVKRELIPVNPVDVTDAGKRVQSKEKYLPKDWELNAILETINPRYRVLTSLMLFHGLRIGEALALEQSHVTFDWLPAPWMPKVTVRVQQNAQRIAETGQGTYMLIQPPKSEAGFRDVPIMATHVPLFIEHWAKHRPTAPTTVQTVDGQREVTLLTATSTGGIVMDTSFRSVLDRAKARAGVCMEIDPHCGRNWLITRLAEQGAHLKEIGRLLGQDDVQTILNVYMKVRAGRTSTLMDKVNATLDPGAPGADER